MHDTPDLIVAIEWGTSDHSVVNVNAAFGADGPAASGSLVYGLQVANAASGIPSLRNAGPSTLRCKRPSARRRMPE